MIGASLSEPHSSVVYGTTCIDRPTDRLCLSHSRDIDKLHVPTLPRRHATVMWTVQSIVMIRSYNTENADNGKVKSRDTRATNCEARTSERTSEPLHTCASLSVLPCILGFHVRQFFSPVTSHKPFFTLSYISTTCVHCSLVTRPRPAFRRLLTVLKATESWAGPGNEAMYTLFWT